MVNNLMAKDKIKKKINLKKTESDQVNSTNLWFDIWDKDNPIKK
jgi:hypothetical protein